MLSLLAVLAFSALGSLALAPGIRAQPPGASTTARVDARDEVIYEVYVRNFTREGTLVAATRRLPEIKDLGATTVWLMPIQPIGEARRKGTLGSPYSIRDYTAVNPELGTDADFQAFVDAAHGLGLKVIIDLVANHTAWDHPWLTAHPDWYTRGADGLPQPPVADWTDVVDLNFDSPEMRAAMLAGMRYWVERFGIDGYRCDVAELVPEDFWVDAIASLRTIKPVLMLAEGTTPGLPAAGFDLTYDWPLYGAMKRVWKEGRSVREITRALSDSATARMPAGHVRLRFTTNHDETAWDRPPMFAFNGTRGAQAAFWTVALLPGAPLVYNGQEGGSTVNTPLFERNPLPPFDPETRDVYAAALDARRLSDVLREGTLVLHDAGDDVLLFERVLGRERVLVAVNTRNRPAALRPSAAIREAYNGTRRAPGVRPRSVLDIDGLTSDADAPVRLPNLTVPDDLTLGGYEVRTWGTVALRASRLAARDDSLTHLVVALTRSGVAT